MDEPERRLGVKEFSKKLDGLGTSIGEMKTDLALNTQLTGQIDVRLGAVEGTLNENGLKQKVDRNTSFRRAFVRIIYALIGSGIITTGILLAMDKI